MKYIIALLVILSYCLSPAQITTFNKNDDLTVSFYKIGFTGVRDNLSGQLSKPLEQTLTNWFQQNKQLSFEFHPYPDFFKLKPSQKAELANTKKWQGLISAEITRSGSLYNIKIQLFDQQGELFFEKEKVGIKEINQNKISLIGQELITHIFADLPYQGWILSRTQNLVTINYGKNHGAKLGDELPIFFVSQVERHPQFKFATKFEKFILGKLVIQKIDNDISFGTIIEERFAGAVEVGSKINHNKMISYPALLKTEEGQLLNPGLNDLENHFVIGRSPKEWRPQRPQFGHLNINTGLSAINFADNTLSGTSAMLPHVALQSEIWLTTQLNLNLALAQSSGQLSFNTGNRPFAATESRLGGYYKFNLNDYDHAQSFFGLGVQLFSSQFSMIETQPLSGLNLTLQLRVALPDSKIAFNGNLENSFLTASKRQNFGISLEFFNQPMRSWLLGLDNTQYSWQNSATPATLGLNRLWLGMQSYF